MNNLRSDLTLGFNYYEKKTTIALTAWIPIVLSGRYCIETPKPCQDLFYCMYSQNRNVLFWPK